MIEIFTIGVYGFTPETFFETLVGARIDTFCDVRRRRGVRGAEYAFANARRLQAALEARSIRYLHILDLSPTDEIRHRQYEADEEAGIGKRERSQLSPQFADAYRKSVLANFDSRAFLEQLGPDARRAVLMCVERDPAACHRSLLADRLARDLGVSVQHLVP